MTPEAFIKRYMLSITLKEAEDQSKAFTDSHVVYKVKIKSVLLPGKIKTQFIQNPAYPAEIGEILFMMASDLMCGPLNGHTLKSYINDYWGSDCDISKAIDIWEAIVKMSNDFQEFFGECGINELLQLEE